MATFKNKRSKADSKPEWIHDHRRVIDGDPFTTAGWDEAQLRRHSGVVIPQPVSANEFFPDQKDVHPTGMFERRSVQMANGQYESFWFDIRYTERANMKEFKRKPDAEQDGRDNAAIRATFQRERKDLA